MRNNLLQRPPFLEEIFVNTSQATRDSATINFKDRRRGREGLSKACKIFSNIRNGKIYVNDVQPTLRALKISMSDGDLRQALKCVYIDVNGMLDFSNFMEILNDRGSFSQDPAFQEAYRIFSKIKGGRVAVEDVLPLLNILGVSVSFGTYQEVMNYLTQEDNKTVDFRDFLFSLEDLQQQYEDVVIKDWPSQDESDRRFSKTRGSRLFQELRKKSGTFPRSSESSSTRLSKRGSEETDLLSSPQSHKRNLSLKKTFERVDVNEFLQTSSKTSISFKKVISQSETYRLEAPPPKAIPSFRRSFHEADIFVASESQQKILKTEEVHELEPVKISSRKSLEEIDKYEICVTGTQPRGSSISLKKYPDIEEIPSVKKSSSFLKYSEEPEQKYGTSVTDLQPPSVKKSSQILRKPSSEIHVPESPVASLDLVELQPEKAKEKVTEKQLPKATEDIQDSLGFFNKLTEDKVAVNELQPILKIIGMDLSDDELEKVLQMTPADDTEMVDLNNFMVNLAKARQFSEYTVLKDAIEIIDKFEDEKVPLDEVRRKLKKLGIYCSKHEFNKALEKIPPDSEGKVDFNKFVKILMSDPWLGQRKSLEEGLKKVETFKGNKVSVHDLCDTLHTLDPDLTEEEFQEALKAVPKDENENVDFDKFFQALEDTRQRAQETIAPSEKILALNMIKDDKVDKKDVDYVLKSMGIVLSTEQLEKLLGSTDDDLVNIKDFVSTLRGTDSFSNFVALKETITTMEQDKTIPLPIKDVYSDVLQRKYGLESAGVPLSDQAIQEVVGAPLLEGPEREKFNVFMTALSWSEKLPVKDALKKGVDVFTHLEAGKISVPELEHALANLNINLPKEKLDQIFASCATDEHGNIQLKDFISGLTEMPEFDESIALQLASSGLENLHDNIIDYDELKDSLIQQGLYAASEVLEQMLPEVTNEQGKVDLSKFMGILSKVLLVPKAAGIKESLSQINIRKSDENIVPELQERLRVLGIHLSDEKIQEALDATSVNEDGTVNLKNFVNNLAATKKFDKCQKIEDAWDMVNKMSNGKVKVDDLSHTLESLGMKLPDKDLEEVLKLIPPDDDGSVKIKDVIEILSKTPQVTRPHGLKKAWTVLSSVTDGKIKKPDLSPALQSWGFELTDEKLKETVKSMEPEELQDAWVVVNSVSDGKVKPSDLRSTLESMGVDLDPEEIEEILKYAHIDGLEHAYNVVTNVTDGKVKMNDLPSTLESLGFDLDEDEVKEVLKSAVPDEAGEVNLKDLVKKLTRTKKLNKTQRLENAWIVVNNVSEGKVNVSDLVPTLKSLGISLTDEDAKEIMESIETDGEDMVNLKDIVNKLTKEKKEKVQSLEASLAVTNVTDGKVKVSDLPPVLEWLGASISKEEINETLKSVAVDGDEKVVLKDFVGKVPISKLSPKIQQTQNIYNVVSNITDGKISIEDLEPTLESLGIELKEKEVKEALKSIQPDEERNVDFKDVVKKVTKSLNLANTQRIQKASNAISNITDGKVYVEDLPSTLESLGIDLSDEDIQETLKSVEPVEDGKVFFKDAINKVVETQNRKKYERIAIASSIIGNVTTDKKIKVEDLPPTLVNLGFRLSEEDIKETLKSLEPDDEGEIEFKDFTKKLMKTENFAKSHRIQNAQNIVTNIFDGKVNIADVMPTLESMGVELSKEKLAETIESIKPDEEGKVKFQDIVDKLVSSKDALKGQQIENACTVLSKVTDGKVALKDLSPTMESLGIELTDEVLEETLKLVEPDDDGKVDFKDIVKRFLKKKKSQTAQKIQKAKNIVSTVSSGMVQVEDLSPTLESFGIKLTDDMLNETLEYVGTDDDGAVDLRKFVKELSRDEEFTKDEKTEKALNAVTKFAEGKVKITDISPTLESLGVKLTKQDLQEALKTVEPDDGLVNLKTFVDKLATVEQFPECQRIEDACNAVTNIFDGKVKVDELMPTLQHLGVKVTDDHMKETLKMVTPDDDEAVNLQEFIDTLAKSEPYGDIQRMENACKFVSSTKDGKVRMDNLSPTLETLGVDLTSAEMKETLKSVQPDKDGAVNLKGFFKKLTEMENFQRCRRLKDACDAFAKIIQGDINISQLKPTMKNLGVSLHQDELNEALKSVEVDEHGGVNLKDFVNVLSKTENFLEGQRLEDAGDIISKVTDGKVKVSDLAPTLESFGVKVTNEDIKEVLPTVKVDRMKQTNNTVSHIIDGKVILDDLESTLENLGVEVTEKELEEVFNAIEIDEDGAVDLKTFMKALAKIQEFHEYQRIENACNIITSIIDGKIKKDYLPETMQSFGIELTDKELEEALETTVLDAR
ncbi:EF-hand calcium-binding domain-containing protein 13 [Trichosurus vulpecula]|uniref:EF-hand calcium-binding domain-containing protein 13 n=1 Tax=Trichosurus vulpecula TaxID=9337 RepID=UPI00186B3B80|nr:EF-hand calcium-binding domain-containing protein 13 [Trichosurus vulpecula]